MSILNRLFKKRKKKPGSSDQDEKTIVVYDPKLKKWIPLAEAENLNIRDLDINSQP